MKKRKIGGQVRVTYEMLSHLLPEGARMISADDNSKTDVVSFKFHSDEIVDGKSFEIFEGQEYPAISITNEYMGEKMLGYLKEIKRLSRYSNNVWAKDVLAEAKKIIEETEGK